VGIILAFLIVLTGYGALLELFPDQQSAIETVFEIILDFIFYSIF
jgi:hypothetical protein